MMMEVDQLPSEEARETGVCRMVDPCAFYVVRVPQAVFSTDPEETLRVSMHHGWLAGLYGRSNSQEPLASRDIDVSLSFVQLHSLSLKLSSGPTPPRSGSATCAVSAESV